MGYPKRRNKQMEKNVEIIQNGGCGQESEKRRKRGSQKMRGFEETTKGEENSKNFVAVAEERQK